MGKFLKDNYYILVRMVLMLIYSMYGLSENMIQAGVPLRLLLLVALYISVMTVKELAEGWKKAALLAAAVIDNILLVVSGGAGFILLACFLGFEILSYLKAAIPVYFLIYLVMFADTPWTLSVLRRDVSTTLASLMVAFSLLILSSRCA